MKMLPNRYFRAAAIFFLGLAYVLNAWSLEQKPVDVLLTECKQYLGSNQQKAERVLEQLQVLRSTFTQTQNEDFHVCSGNYLSLKGKHEEHVELIQSFLDQVRAPNRRALFLYQLVDAYTALGKYENALLVMNEAILLLPKLEGVRVKASVLQGAINLLESFHAYDESLDFAERMYALRGGEGSAVVTCVGLANKVEINFLRGNSQLAHSLVPDAILACSAKEHELFSLAVKSNSAIDSIESGKYASGINAGLPLLRQWSVVSKGYATATLLEEALARAYLKTGNAERAEHFGMQSFRDAQSASDLALQEKTSETMATIKRANGDLTSAIYYYDINLALKKKIQGEQLQKNLAYQRVKFDTQDKVNQMALLDQKNKNLIIEKELQNRKVQNLILLLTLGVVALTILGAWLARTLRQKNLFRATAQIDALTQVNNRGHFVTSARRVFVHTSGKVSLVLFDMDLFKHINDTYGHSTGDWVLKTVCDVVRAQLRNIDMLGRLGGEEFAICLPLSSDEEVSALAERCRAAVEAIDTKSTGFSFPITASFGIATRESGGSQSFEETLVAADKALYFSKNQGRNRVTVFQATFEDQVPQKIGPHTEDRLGPRGVSASTS